ncbi:Proteasomal ATPase-associated factor 1 [Desmophyllum pertusum]|uniref:Proteasomal ATPase-associated factor 1 n=1 Tax=Desmophyllum pertusum TaxID=174260 RepID=A0A9X0A0S2_9CNID|nr:Proteasomal ATPase-associated factor 1 [Desmophyllum pertusum]
MSEVTTGPTTLHPSKVWPLVDNLWCRDLISPGRNAVSSEREVGTEGKLLLLAKEDGFLDGVDVHNRKKVFQFKCPSAVNCCTFLSEYEAVAGTEDGSLWILDVRSPSCPVGVFRRSSSPILSLSALGDRAFIASTGGGSCFCWSAELLNRGRRGEVTSWELIGPDCEPIYSICRSSNTVYSACRDANIRKYVFRQSELSS